MATTTYGTEYVQSSDLVSNWPGSSLSVANRIDDVSLKGNGLNNQTGTSYTLVLTDGGKNVILNNASAVSLTVPTNASVAFPTGVGIGLVNKGAGTVTVAAAGGVTINGNLTLGINDRAILIKLDTNTWVISNLGGSITGQNLLYNGAMQLAQRSTSVASITTSGYYTADRFVTDITTIGTWTQSVENDAPTGSGFRKSLKMLCTTADGSPAAGDILSIAQSLEGQDLQLIRKGTSDARQMTLSFWVKANVTGTYTVLVFDNDNSRATSFAYSISASATWERKTILIPADTTGAFDNDNAASLTVFFCLGAGTNFTSGSLQATWASYTAANRAVGQVNLAAATNNYWQVTGVQLEVGGVASAFEFKSYGQELRECQRYFYKSSDNTEFFANGFTSTSGQKMVQSILPVSMRTVPSVTPIDSAGNRNRITTANLAGTTTNNQTVDLADGMSNRSCRVLKDSTHTGFYFGVEASAEL